MLNKARLKPKCDSAFTEFIRNASKAGKKGICRGYETSQRNAKTVLEEPSRLISERS